MNARSLALLGLRATAFGLVAASLAAFGHWAAGGHFPALGPWLGFTFLTSLLVTPLLRRERGWLSIALALAPGR